MNKTFFKIGLGLLALAGLAWPSRGDVPGMKTLHGHVPAIVSKLAPLGRVNATNELHLAIGLPLRNQEALTNLSRQLYDPASPNYRHFLSPDEFTAKFGPTAADYQAVLDFASSNGLTVEHTYGNRTLVDVVGKTPDVERAFHVTMMSYHHPTEARDFYAPDAEPTVNSMLPVLAVQGMNNYALPHPLSHKRPAIPQPSFGTGPQGGYMGQDFRNAYLPGCSLNGANQFVGLFQFDGYLTSDILNYESLAGLTNVPLQNVLLDNFNGQPGGNNVEVCMDIEVSISMAPGLAGVVVFEAGPYGNADDILSTMVSSNQIKQFSASWAYPTDATSDQFYMQFAVQGQTFLNASGDGDAWLGGIPFQFGVLEDPNVTLVGGTTLFMNGNGVSYASEQAWNWGFYGDYVFNPDGYAGTSGGISTDVPIPYYQMGIDMVTNLGSTTFRNTPDVALTADNIFVEFDGGQEDLEGGTSAASPLWAGFMALVNQQAAAVGQPSVGFLAPAVYAIAKTSSYTNCFHDVMTGSNTWDLSPNNYYAVPGYDLCTGLGTPNGINLINALAGTNIIVIPPTPVVPAPKQPWGSTLGIMDGSDPNGLWFLFFQDDNKNGYSGTNYNGWLLNLTTANPVGFPADNQLFVGATNVSITPGSSWTTILAVTNYGPAIATNVYVSDSLPDPSGVTLLSSTFSIAGASVTTFGDTLTWNIGALPLNAGGTLTLTFRGNVAGVYTNGAIVYSANDPNLDDDSVGVNITIAPTPAPTITPHFFASGSKGFSLSVTNDAGSTVIIQASTNLFTWVPVDTNIAPFTFTNFDNTNFSHRFYRAVIQQ